MWQLDSVVSELVLVARTVAVDVVLTIALICFVLERAASLVALMARLMTGHIEGLIHRTEGRSHVFQLVVDVGGNL